MFEKQILVRRANINTHKSTNTQSVQNLALLSNE